MHNICITYDLFAVFTIRYSLEKSNEDKQARPEQPYIGGIAYGGYARKIIISTNSSKI